MQTTTIRVDAETHARLQTSSEQWGAILIETVRDATEALRRQRVAHQVAAELAELRTDEEVWKFYLVGADATRVTDGRKEMRFIGLADRLRNSRGFAVIPSIGSVPRAR